MIKLSANQTLIRPAVANDCSQLASLTEELGYPATLEQTAERLNQICERVHDQVIFVVEIEQKIAGFIHVGLRTTLATPRSAEIYELVVTNACRSRGLGGLLLAQAEAWGRSLNCQRMLVRSRIDREDAHRFYKTAGYTTQKTQEVFGKELR